MSGTLTTTFSAVNERVLVGIMQRAGNAFVDLIDDVFDNYRQFQHSNDFQQYTSWAKQFKSKLSHALNTWIPKASAFVLNLLSKLRTSMTAWWFFLDHPEVPPDNNLAERSLRLAVTKRKVSGGSRYN